MQISIKDISRAKQAAKSLKANLDDWHLFMPLTWHQDTVAMMLGHKGWADLSKCIASGAAPSPLDAEVSAEEAAFRHEFQFQVLVSRVGADNVDRFGGESTFRTITKHVAPSGRPTAGSAFKTLTVELTEDGIALPSSLDLWTETALFQWHGIPSTDEYEHLTRAHNSEGESLCYEYWHRAEASVKARLREYLRTAPDDDITKFVLLSRIAAVEEGADKAEHYARIGYSLGSMAWAPVASERRRRHDPVKWWTEPSTRPFMRAATELASLESMSLDLAKVSSGLSLFKAVLALCSSDPLQVRQKMETAIWVAETISRSR